jgi:hypothetical protein
MSNSWVTLHYTFYESRTKFTTCVAMAVELVHDYEQKTNFLAPFVAIIVNAVWCEA